MMQVLGLTAQIVSAHVAHNQVAASKLPDLINSVFDALKQMSTGASTPAAAAATTTQKPTVPAARSVFPGYIVCLDCGKKLSTLKRHVMTVHDMSPEQYRARWGLPGTYPMVAPDYAKQRSAIAKETGLGRGGNPKRRTTSPRRTRQ